MELDHVLLALPDLGTAARDFELAHGLESIEGGHHPGWGTANRIVPLGDAYVELVAVVDREAASANAFGRLVARAAASESPLLGWAARPNDLDDVAARLGLEIEEGSRARPDGTEIRWRAAGVEVALEERYLPFFIEWAEGTKLPGHAATATPATIDEVVVTGDPDRLAWWLGPTDVPVTVTPGRPAVRSIRVAPAEGVPIAIGG